ncbi:MAG: FtsX-like permease family protein [Saprospiraceae bacterium]
MLKNILLTSIRNIFRNPLFSFINVFGLAVSMSLGLLIILIIKDQYSFDNFHKDSDRIFRVNTKALRTDGGSENYASAPFPLGISIKDGYSFAENIVLINNQLNGDAVYRNVIVPVHGFFADSSFLKVFNFKLEKGNPSTVLNDPDGLILTTDAAKKIFGNEDPMGKVVKFDGYGEFTVKGVFEKLSAKTHLDFEIIASLGALPLLEKQGAIKQTLNNWNNYYSNYVYIKIKKGENEKEINAALAQISRKHYAERKLETRDKGYEFYLHSLKKISPGPILSNSMGKALPVVILLFLGILAFTILLMAGLNYTNLMIAKSLKRSREIGVRKVLGATRWQIFLQFIGESVIFALVSLAASYLILQFLKTALLQLHLVQEFSIDLTEDKWVYIYFILFAISIGIFAGLLPAGYLSGFKPIVVLKNMMSKKGSERQLLRKGLMVVQFTISMVFIATVFVIFFQMRYLMQVDYGINDKNILNVNLSGNDYKKLSVELGSVAGVKQIGFVSHRLGTFQDYSDDYKLKISDAPFVMRDFRADPNFISNLKLRFAAGRNFATDLPVDRETEVIINEKALGYFNFKSADEAIGQQIYASDSIALSIVGVVNDFHFRPMNYEIGPLAFRYRPADFQHMSIAFEPGCKDKIIKALSSIWKNADPVHQLEYNLMRQDIDDAYESSGFTDILKIMEYVSFLSIIIACLGMLGMVMYNTQLRIKEVSIRKVMGAGVKDVTLLLSRSFIWLIGIGVAIGIPLSYLLGNLILQNFAYKISCGIWLISAGGVITALLGLIAICSQTIKAALANPVKNLRTE